MIYLCIKFYLWILSIFLLHGFWAGMIMEPRGVWVLVFWEAQLVRLASDIWIAALATVLLTLFLGLAKLIKISTDRLSKISSSWFFILAGLTALHQNYVQFFKIQIIPQHLVYMTDRYFIAANYQELFHWKAIVLFALTVIGTFDLVRCKSRNVDYKAYLAFGMLMILCLGLHAWNIRYRVQWFIHEQAQVNFMEKLYLNFKEFIPAKALKASEKALLRKKLKGYDFIFKKWQVGDIDSASLSFAALKTEVAATKNLRSIFVLLESARPTESSLLSGNTDKESLMPELDSLVRQGVWFKKAYASGTVTRSGQEAVWCGFPSAVGRSLMRKLMFIDITCLPEILPQQTLWIHGGKAAFDGQEVFWKKHKIDHLVSQKVFPEDSVSTPWGVADHTVFQKAADLLAKEKRPQLAMILSLTNHTPWTLPDDLLIDVKESLSHPSFMTTFYTDKALGKFVQRLKDDDLWDHTLLFIISDHATRLPAYNDSMFGEKLSLQELSSRIIFVMSGGVVEKSMGATVVEDLVWQPSIHNFYLWLTDNEQKLSLAPRLGSKQPGIFVTLEEGTYFPSERLFLKPKELNSFAKDSQSQLSALLETYYFRHFMSHLGEK